MPEYQHVHDPIKEAHPSWYNGTFDAPHLMKGPLNHPYRILGPRDKWPTYAEDWKEEEFLQYRLWIDLKSAYSFPLAVDGDSTPED